MPVKRRLVTSKVCFGSEKAGLLDHSYNKCALVFSIVYPTFSPAAAWAMSTPAVPLILFWTEMLPSRNRKRKFIYFWLDKLSNKGRAYCGLLQTEGYIFSGEKITWITSNKIKCTKKLILFKIVSRTKQ